MPKKKKPKLKKTRKIWEISPRTRVHDEKGYKRSEEKDEKRKEIEEEEE